MARKPPKWLKWIPPRLRKGIEQLVPYVPSHPQPIPPPPYVPPPRDLTITAPVQNATVNDDTPAITGTTTGTSAVTVTITQAGATVQTLAPATPSGGTWVATAAHLNDGVYTASASQTINSQLVTASKTFTVAVVTPPPPPPQVAILVPSTGSTTADNTPTITGTATGASVVTVLVKQGGATVQTLSPTPSGGTWTTTATTLPDGAYTVEAAQTVSGITGNATPIVFTVDAVPNPAVTSVAGGGQSSSTTDTTPTVVGTGTNRSGDATTVTVIIAQGGSTVQTLSSVPLVGTNWTVTPTTALALGAYVVRVTQGSTSGTGTSSDFPFTVAAAGVVPTPTITGPTEGQALSSGSVVFIGTGGQAQGDALQVTVRVYPAASGTQQAQVSATVIVGGPFNGSYTTQTQPITVPNGSWRARVEQQGTAGLGVSAFRNFTVSAVVSVAIAMPRGAVDGFGQAADFYDLPGVCHHPEYFGNDAGQRAAGISALQELGVRNVRVGFWSPANHGAVQGFQEGSQYFLKDLRRENENRNPATTQPVFGLIGTSVEPQAEAARGSAVYTVTNSDGTFLKPLDGPQQNIPVAIRGPSAYNSDSLLENAGTYYDVGWEIASGLQGPNEPDNAHAPFQGTQTPGIDYFYPIDIRQLFRALRDARAARTNEVVLGGESYIDSSTGRITAGPAHAPQLPIVGFSLTGNNWTSMGDYSDGLDITVGSPHMYWGGHSPIYDEYFSTTAFSWRGSHDSYNGAYSPGGKWSRTIPEWVTESGYIQKPGTDPGSGERYTPSDVVGEYYIRTAVQFYLGGVRRVYFFSLNDISQGTYGMCATDWTRRASFYALKNLLAVVGFQQGTTDAPITVTNNFAPGPNDLTSMASKPGGIVDRLDQLVLQQAPTSGLPTYLLILSRQKQLWNRDTQSYVVPSNPQNVTVTLPAGTWTTSVCEPAKNAVASPSDGQSYAHPNDGTWFEPAGTAGNGFTQAGNVLTVRMAGLTRIVKLVKTG